MKAILGFFLAALFVSACSASGFKQMGDWIDLPDGSKITGFQAKNSGVSGPDVTAIETWRCPPNADCSKVGAYSGSAPGAVEVGVAGALAAGLAAGGNVGAAAVFGMNLPKNVGDNIKLSNESENTNVNKAIANPTNQNHIHVEPQGGGCHTCGWGH